MSIGSAVQALQQDEDLVRTYEVLGAFRGADRIGMGKTANFRLIEMFAEADVLTGVILASAITSEYMDAVELANAGKDLPSAVRTATGHYINRFLNGSFSRNFRDLKLQDDVAGSMMLIGRCLLDLRDKRAMTGDLSGTPLRDFIADIQVLATTVKLLLEPQIQALYPAGFLLLCAAEGRAAADMAAGLLPDDEETLAAVILMGAVSAQVLADREDRQSRQDAQQAAHLAGMQVRRAIDTRKARFKL